MGGQERPRAARLGSCRPPTAEGRFRRALVAHGALAALFSRVVCPAVALFAPLSTRASGSAGLISVAGASLSGACRLFLERGASHLSRLAPYRSPAFAEQELCRGYARPCRRLQGLL